VDTFRTESIFSRGNVYPENVRISETYETQLGRRSRTVCTTFPFCTCQVLSTKTINTSCVVHIILFVYFFVARPVPANNKTFALLSGLTGLANSVLDYRRTRVSTRPAYLHIIAEALPWPGAV
jgi:hypothetical protein